MIRKAERLFDIIDRAAEAWPDKTAVVSSHDRLDYKTLRERADSLACGFLDLGIGKGDMVTVQLTNSAEWFYVEYALMKMGAVLVPVNTRYKPEELKYVLEHSDAVAHIMQAGFRDLDYVKTLYAACPGIEIAVAEGKEAPLYLNLRKVICVADQPPPGMHSLTQLMEQGKRGNEGRERLTEVQDQVSPEDLAHLPYTSGTTGRPKGVMTTHAQYLWFLQGLKEIARIEEKDRVLVPLPFSHNYGNMAGIYLSALCGATSIIIEVFDPAQTLKLISREKASVFVGTPTMYIKMLQDPDFSHNDYSSLRLLITGAAPSPVSLIHGMQKGFGVQEVLNGYGMTENSVGTCCTRIGDPPEVVASYVGLPMPGAEVRIVQPNTGVEQPRGMEGELQTRGLMVIKGYYKMPKETSDLFDDTGWFHTGDLAVMDERGYVKITGRLKDVIMPGGMNYAPGEVEDLLFTHPKIKQAYVVGVPDKVMGEIGMAFVQLKDGKRATEQEIIDFCKSRLANFKVPRYVKFCSDFPMTALGKVQKFILRDSAVKELGLSAGE